MRPIHSGISQVMAFSIFVDTADLTFDPAPILSQYPMQLTRLEDWAHRQAKVHTDEVRVAA